MRTVAYVLCVSTLCILLAAAPATAHRASIFAYTEGNEVITESSFSSGGPVMHSLVQVKDAATGALLLEGQTNEKGIFRFPLPPQAQQATKGLQIILDAKNGHRGEWLLEPEEYLSNPPASPATTAPKGDSSNAAYTPEPAATGSAVDTAALEQIVAAAVDRKIAPLKRILLESQEKIRMSDIIGGIGYLVGFAGLLAYLRSKRAAK